MNFLNLIPQLKHVHKQVSDTICSRQKSMDISIRSQNEVHWIIGMLNSLLAILATPAFSEVNHCVEYIMMKYAGWNALTMYIS